MFVRFAWPRFAALWFVVLASFTASPVLAQEPSPAGPAPAEVAALGLREAASVSLDQIASQQVAVTPAESRFTSGRPKALVPLYASFVALQGLDVHSTRRGLANGASEANPVLKGVAGNTGALVAVKAASTAGIIFGVEKLRKKNRALAIATMVVLNSATALVVRHNYKAGSR